MRVRVTWQNDGGPSPRDNVATFDLTTGESVRLTNYFADAVVVELLPDPATAPDPLAPDPLAPDLGGGD